MRFMYLQQRPEVLPQVARWYVDQWGHLKPDRTCEMMQKELHAYLNTARIPLLVVAVTDETVIGAAQLKFREMTIYPEKEHWLGGVYIDAAHRGKGAATRMVSHMVKLARELGVETLYLQTDDPSGGLYARLGWQPLERVHYIGREVLVMENVLGHRKKAND